MSDSDCLVSIIIPAFNAEQHLGRCLQSCLGQSHGNLEIIVVNDGSTDATQAVAESYRAGFPRFQLHQVPNAGQGAARNMALRAAHGDFVFFLDADDAILPDTIKTLLGRALATRSDIVICDWCFVNEEGAFHGYSNLSAVIESPLLSERDISRFLRRTYFTVNKIYRKRFLLDNHIEFGEGYIYEDIEFYVGSMLRAGRISYCSYPFYRIFVNQDSTTKSRFDSDRHARGFAAAIRSTVEKYREELSGHVPSFVNYAFRKSYTYTVSQRRVPVRFWVSFMAEVIGSLAVFRREANFGKLGIKSRLPIIISSHSRRISALVFYALYWSFRETESSRVYWFFSSRLRRVRDRQRQKKNDRAREAGLRAELNEATIFFHGFDGTLKGNTRHFLQEADLHGFDLIVVGDPELVEGLENVRFLAKGSPEYYFHAHASKFHILETWSDLGLKKRHGAVWIQMWHGTPIKKMLFDSSERFIVNRNRAHKRRKYADICRWDYLLSQNPFCSKKLASAFAFDESRVLEIGYPRTDCFHQDGALERVKRVRDKYRIGDEKMVLYAPTWRDYNEFSFGKDFEYFLDVANPPPPENYTIVALGHPFARSAIADERLTFSQQDDVQDLILAADCLITDYSSIVFDWLLLNKPFALLWKDRQCFEFARGLYPEFEADFGAYIHGSENAVFRFLEAFPGYGHIANIAHYTQAAGGSSEALSRMLRGGGDPTAIRR